MAFDLGDYVGVDERIATFREKHPEGSLQADVIAWPTSELPFVVVKGYAYRTPNDERPGIGWAWEPFPGKTPYTKDSELQNAETSAWGRAIVAALAADTKRGIATQEDVRNRAEARNRPEPSKPTWLFPLVEEHGEAKVWATLKRLNPPPNVKRLPDFNDAPPEWRKALTDALSGAKDAAEPEADPAASENSEGAGPSENGDSQSSPAAPSEATQGSVW